MIAMQRTATCSSGALKLTTTGEPGAVVACHCLFCPRRTGSPFGVGAYFPQAQVAIEGDSKQYTRAAVSGNPMVNHFCPTCGSTVYWLTARAPGTVGIAVGAFGDPKFPAPIRSVWEQSMHAWTPITSAAQHMPR